MSQNKQAYVAQPGAKLLFHVSLFVFILCLGLALANKSLNGSDVITSLLISIGTAFGPVTVVMMFLRSGFEPIIEAAAKDAMQSEMKEFRDQLSARLLECKMHSDELQKNSETLSVLRRCGIVAVHEERREALSLIKQWINNKQNREFIFVGTSFRGLYWDLKGDPEILRTIKRLALENKADLEKHDSLYMRFLFTHPAFAYLREKGEGAEREDSHFRIREEILTSALMLRRHGIPAHCIKFYKGTPTLFGVMTNNHMYINPYPYKKQAYTSLGFTMQRQPDEGSHFSAYDIYRRSHFEGAWNDSENTEFWDDSKLESFWKCRIEDISPDRTPLDVPAKLHRLIEEIKKSNGQQ